MSIKIRFVSATPVNTKASPAMLIFHLACWIQRSDTVNGPYAYIPASTANRTMSAALGTLRRFINIDRCIFMVRSLRSSS